MKRETESAPTQNRIIVHVDLNAFYPSVEIVQNPSLKGKLVIVGADPKGGKGRGVVVSCSYEARRYGVRSGMPISRAYSLISDAAYIRPDFALYARVSRRVMNLLRAYADKFEQVSIDEAFLDVSDRVNSRLRFGKRIGYFDKSRSRSEGGFILFNWRSTEQVELKDSLGVPKAGWANRRAT